MSSIQEIKNFCIQLKNLDAETSTNEDIQGVLEILNIPNEIENIDDDELFREIYDDVKDAMDIIKPDSQDILKDFYSYYSNEEKFNHLKIRTLQQIHKNWQKIYEKIKVNEAFTHLNMSKKEMKIMVENFGIVLCNDLGIIDTDLQSLFNDDEGISVDDSTIERLIEFI